MFTVPGWNVSAPIKAQVEQPKPQDPNKLGKKALKRKREQEEQKVNTADLGKLWEQAEAQKAVEKKEETKKTTVCLRVRSNARRRMRRRRLLRARQRARRGSVDLGRMPL